LTRSSSKIDEANEHFGWFAHFVAADSAGSSKWTRERPGWQPKKPGLISDIDRPSYFQTNQTTYGQKERGRK
jgi:hypothetical protein